MVITYAKQIRSLSHTHSILAHIRSVLIRLYRTTQDRASYGCGVCTTFEMNSAHGTARAWWLFYCVRALLFACLLINSTPSTLESSCACAYNDRERHDGASCMVPNAKLSDSLVPRCCPPMNGWSAPCMCPLRHIHVFISPCGIMSSTCALPGILPAWETTNTMIKSGSRVDSRVSAMVNAQLAMPRAARSSATPRVQGPVVTTPRVCGNNNNNIIPNLQRVCGPDYK